MNHQAINRPSSSHFNDGRQNARISASIAPNQIITIHYKSGKYVADGTWSDTAVSKQCGSAVLLRRMAEVGQVGFIDQPVPKQNSTPIVPMYAVTSSKDVAIVLRVEELQKWLNTFPGIFVKVDGVPGGRTSEAYRRVTGSYLPGDPRAR
ncbi:hypothetical protein H8K52_15785 [Undibacterium seohonense]|uniref:Uncharacterized protein n=1 Tax=Undibacterium seohonense TaxID=1344950 RepID=A0ABR6X766_9BURK|nr:hypothetical protein [Undibacterium seohonense]MBC3808803.1 hypothetical protein [Undibacterium seohonense]